jgi:hypothetical protein
MAIQWADDFSRYGTKGQSRTRMQDGLVYTFDPLYGQAFVLNDPDPNIPNGKCLRVDGSGPNWPAYYRAALPTPVSATVRMALRFWMTNLPTNSNRRPSPIGFQNNSGQVLAMMRIEQNGAIQILGRVSNNLTVLADTVSPKVGPNSWNHFEMSYNVGAGTGTLFVNGVQTLTYTGVDLGLGPVTLVHFSPATGNDGTPYCYIKDLVIADSTGTQNNGVLGTVLVKRLRPSSDDTLGGWTPSYGTSGHKLLRDSVPFNHLIATGTPNTSNNIQIGTVHYRFTTGNVDANSPAGTSSNPWLVNRGSNAEQALSNLRKAINASGTPGTDYSTALTAHPTIEADGVSADRLSVAPKDGTSSAFTFAENDSNLYWLSQDGFLIDQFPGMITDGRPNDLTYMSAADNPLPSPMRFEMEDLPPDITSVRALITVTRHRKIDGGDGNVQTALSPNGTNWDNGADRPITTAFQYDFDVSEVSPVTSSPWTPVEVDSLKLRINRTL